MEEIKKCYCKMCEHEWFPRTSKSPVQCPLCKSIKWNTGRKENERKNYGKRNQDK